MPAHFATLDAVIEHYLDRRRAAPILSAREAVVALRALMPDIQMSDGAFAELFVAAAIARGRNVAFDMREEPMRTRR